ncbi:lipopolysaccharide biosynthesis protein [Nonomuraea lactucae]|uniref:lipopolysaccharide biosynthesis protein n=1 Tax=Nonomuraea lactucae TaxID=2249762 RepID=UPI000DE3AB50|nr:lipopolysaccharide biosynthesis protein [Nonomuraea lactucae]
MAPLTPGATDDPAASSAGPVGWRGGGLLGRVGRGGLAGVSGAAASAVAQFLLVMVVTRAFSPEQAGAFFTATALALMTAGVARLDAGNGLVFFIARAKTYGYRGMSGYVRAALVPSLAVALAAAVLLYPRLGPLALAIPVMVAADVLLAATRGFGTMRPTVALDGLFLPLAQLLLVATVTSPDWLFSSWSGGVSSWPPVVPSPSAGWPVVVWALPYLVVLVLAAAALRRRLPRTPYMPGTGRDLWRHTAPRSVAAAIQAVFQRLDIVVVAVLGGPAQAAVYTAATRFKIVGQLANQGLAQAAQPRLVRALADGELGRARELYQATTAWLVLLTWPIWLGYAALAPWVLRLFGPEYGSALPVALVLAATMMLATACGMVDVVLTAAGHTTASLLNLVTAIALTIALDIALIPAHGALGAVLGWAGGVLVKNLLPLWQLHRRYGLHPFGRHSLAALRVHSSATA